MFALLTPMRGRLGFFASSIIVSVQTLGIAAWVYPLGFVFRNLCLNLSGDQFLDFFIQKEFDLIGVGEYSVQK